MKKIKIKSYLWSGIVMGLLSGFLLWKLPTEVRIPTFDSGAPSPRIIPAICLILMLISSIILIIESLVFKKEKIVEFDWEKEKPAILMIVMMCVYAGLIIYIGFVVASIITFVVMLLYCGEKKPLVYIITAAAAIGIFFLFKNVFYVSLPALWFR